MGNQVLEREFDDEALERKYHLTDDGRLKERIHMVLLADQDRSCEAIGEIVRRSRQTVATWLHRFNEDGLTGLEDEPRDGKPPKLDEEEKEELKKDLKKSPRT